MSRLSRLSPALAVLAALALPAAASAAPAYYPSGPQQDVARATVLAGGWEVCYSGTFYEQSSIADILAACDGDYLMLAGGLASSADYQLLAAAPRADVLFASGANYGNITPSTVSQLSNGTQWYFSDDWSWGFANGGDAVRNYSCDVEQSGTSAMRMCWHTNGGTLGGGYRVGNSYDGNNERVVLQSTAVRTIGAPNTVSFADQTQSTTSPRQTVTYKVSAHVGASDAERTLGALDTYGANAAEFDVTWENCPEMAPADGSEMTCEARVRFTPDAVGGRTATMRFANASDTVTLNGTGVAPPQGAPGVPGAPGDDGPTGAPGNDGPTGARGIDGAKGIAGTNGTNGVDGANGTTVRPAATKVRCTQAAYRSGARLVCTFNRRMGRKALIQLRDRRGSLSTAGGNGKRRMVFVAKRKPRGTVYAFVVRGLPTS